MTKNHAFDVAALVRDLKALVASTSEPSAPPRDFYLQSLERLDSVRRDGETRDDVLRVAVDREIRRREHKRGRGS